jgi:hypothetical protein
MVRGEGRQVLKSSNSYFTGTQKIDFLNKEFSIEKCGLENVC